MTALAPSSTQGRLWSRCRRTHGPAKETPLPALLGEDPPRSSSTAGWASAGGAAPWGAASPACGGRPGASRHRRSSGAPRNADRPARRLSWRPRRRGLGGSRTARHPWSCNSLSELHWRQARSLSRSEGLSTPASVGGTWSRFRLKVAPVAVPQALPASWCGWMHYGSANISYSSQYFVLVYSANRLSSNHKLSNKSLFSISHPRGHSLFDPVPADWRGRGDS